MEYKSAIKDAIEELKYSIEPNQGFMECRTGTISKETIKLAIEALEKHVPKKPVNLTCPNCGFDKIDNSWWVFPYCPKCGQCLDWSDEDD